MNAAKRKAIKGILDHWTFSIILKEDLPADGNVLPCRFIIAIESAEYDGVKFLTRYFIGGHRDEMKRVMVHNAQTFQPLSIRLILARTAAHNFQV